MDMRLTLGTLPIGSKCPVNGGNGCGDDAASERHCRLSLTVSGKVGDRLTLV